MSSTSTMLRWMLQCSCISGAIHLQVALEATFGQVCHTCIACLMNQAAPMQANAECGLRLQTCSDQLEGKAEQCGHHIERATLSPVDAQLSNRPHGGNAHSFCSKAGGMLMPHFCEAIWASLAYCWLPPENCWPVF